MYHCQNCEHVERADNNCIYVNNITHEIDELQNIVGDVITDPTLPRTQVMFFIILLSSSVKYM